MKQCSLYITALMLSLSACSGGGEVDVMPTPPTNNQGGSGVANRVPLRVSARMTRAINNVWSAGDSIGVVLFDVGTADLSDGKTNYHYITEEAGTGNFSAFNVDHTAYYPQSGGNVDILAYYPYNPKVGDDLLIPVSTTDQSFFPRIDFMVTDKLEDRNADNPSVALTFRHKMARLNLTLSKDEINAEAVDLSTAKITYMGGPMTAVCSMSKQDFSSKGPATNLAFPFDAAKGKGTAIVIPTSETDTLVFKIEAVAWGGFVNTYYAKLKPGEVLAPGTDNNVAIKINQDEVKTFLEVTDWTVKETITGNGEAAYE